MTGIDRGSCAHTSSFCYPAQVAKAIDSTRYSSGMDETQIQAWRIERLRAAIDKLTEGNITAFGKRLGYRDGAYIGQMLRGDRPISEKTIRAVEALPGLASWFHRGLKLKALSSDDYVEESDPWIANQAAEDAVAAATEGTAGKSIGIPARPISVYNSLDELPPEATVLIAHVDVALSAGNGRETWHIEEKPPLPFLADYIRRLDCIPKNLVAVKVRGDSMEPRLFDGDTVVVDRADRRIPASGGVFAVVYAGEMLVKRLFKLPDGSIDIVSDNNSYKSLAVPPDQLEHIDIVGRVKYRSGTGDF